MALRLPLNVLLYKEYIHISKGFMLKVIAKFLFASLLVGWLIQSGKLDLKLINKSLQNPGLLIICILILMGQICFAAQRWRLILLTKAEKAISYRAVVPIAWIGQFFNTFLPGAVTGDFIKLLYAKDLCPSLTKTFLITSALMDRILGLVGLLIIMGIATVLNYSRLSSLSPEMENLMQFNLFLFLCGASFIVSLMLPAKIQKTFLRIAKKIPFIGNKIYKLFFEVWAFGRNRLTIFYCILFSIFNQFFGILTFYLISSPYYEKEIFIRDVFSLIPIGQITIAIPISPSGLGVGHFIYDKLFQYIGQSGGASFFNIYFLIAVTVNLLGFFPYVMNKKHHSLKEAESFEENLPENS